MHLSVVSFYCFPPKGIGWLFDQRHTECFNMKRQSYSKTWRSMLVCCLHNHRRQLCYLALFVLLCLAKTNLIASQWCSARAPPPPGQHLFILCAHSHLSCRSFSFPLLNQLTNLNTPPRLHGILILTNVRCFWVVFHCVRAQGGRKAKVQSSIVVEVTRSATD